MDKDRKKRLLDLLPIILTTVIAISACLSTYFSYQAIRIASEQKRIQSRQEIFDYIKTFLEMAAEHSKKSNEKKTVELEDKKAKIDNDTNEQIPNFHSTRPETPVRKN